MIADIVYGGLTLAIFGGLVWIVVAYSKAESKRH